MEQLDEPLGILRYAGNGVWYWYSAHASAARHIPKNAGFRWDYIKAHYWATTHPEIAWALDEYADAKAKRALRACGMEAYNTFRRQQQEREQNN
jgi:hypothetical protein